MLAAPVEGSDKMQCCQIGT